MSYDIYTAVDSIGHAKSTQNHPESVATVLNQGSRVKNSVIIGVGNPDNRWYLPLHHHHHNHDFPGLWPPASPPSAVSPQYSLQTLASSSWLTPSKGH